MTGGVVRAVPSGRQLLDAVVYAVALTAVLVLVSAAVSLGRYYLLPGGRTGSGFAFDVLYRLSNTLFVLAVFVFGVAAWKLRPTPAWKRDDDDEGGSAALSAEEDAPPLSRATQRVIPASLRLPPTERLSAGWKLLLASVCTFLASVASTLPVTPA